MVSGQIELRAEGGFYDVPEPQALIVLLHAYDSKPTTLQRMAQVAREEYPHSDIYAPRLPISVFSCANPETIARGIVEFLGRRPRIGSYEKIILIGHSLGAVLARCVWALAHGATPAGAVDSDKVLPWAGRIDRIILVAALNRGWTVSSALSPLNRLVWTVGTAWGNLLRHVLRKEPVVFGVRRGAAFLTTVRLQCLAVEAYLGERRPITVQFLGTSDDFIAPTDNVDLSTGKNFFYIEVDDATHSGIVELREGKGETSALERFRLALTAKAPELKEISLPPEDVFDGCDETDDFDASILPERNLAVKHVVFVIHGIRDRGFWTRRLARKVKSVARANGEQCRSVTSTYGFFPMGPFLLPWIRRNKVEWLLDQYVAAKSLYPEAEFSYIGHSNGTYLLAKALEICPAISFMDGVVFAGSMVRRNFEWEKYIPSRVSRMINYVATDDWVVAIFPYGLERLRLQDVGGAGHLGFLAPDNANIRYAVGEHSAALVPDKWQEMADFVLNKIDPPNLVAGISPSPRNLTRGRWSPAIMIGLVVLVLGIGAAMLFALDRIAGAWGPVLALLFAFYLYLLRLVLTRA